MTAAVGGAQSMRPEELIVDVIGDARFVRHEEVGCPLCGEMRPSRRISARFGMNAYVAECLPCRVAFQTPRPSPDATLAYMNGRWQSSDDYVANVDDQRRRASKQIELVKRYVREPRRLLDVGAGAGSFVRAALDQEWNAVGIERSGAAISRAKQFYEVDLLSEVPPEQFDVITLWDVIEHLRDPQEFLMMLQEHLTEDGYLFVETGNLESWLRAFLGDEWHLYLFDHHYYFSPSSLQEILRRAGYDWCSLVDCNRVHPSLHPARILRHPVRSAKAWRAWAATRARWSHSDISVMVVVARKKAPALG
jgi:SAM-dependent methyltransferase